MSVANGKVLQCELQKDPAGPRDQRFGFSSVSASSASSSAAGATSGEGGLEITRVDRGGLLAKWNTARRAGGPAHMVGVGDVIISVNGVGKVNVEGMRRELERDSVRLQVLKVRS